MKFKLKMENKYTWYEMVHTLKLFWQPYYNLFFPSEIRTELSFLTTSSFKP